MELVCVLSDRQIEKVAELARVIWREHYADILISEQIEYMLEYFQSFSAVKEQIAKGYSYYLIREDSKTAGYLAFCRTPDSDNGRMYLSKLYLRREFRGRKLAKRAVAFLESLSASEGIGTLYLTVNRYNAQSKAAYESMGFAAVREEKSDIGNGYYMDDFIMEKSIKPEPGSRACEAGCACGGCGRR